MSILEIIKSDLGITNTEKDIELNKYINEITNKIKSICNRTDLPEQLEYLVIKYAEDCYNYYKDKDSTKNEHLVINSASDNGQSVNFKVAENVSKDDIDLNKVIEKNRDEISMYAYMRW